MGMRSRCLSKGHHTGRPKQRTLRSIRKNRRRIRRSLHRASVDRESVRCIRRIQRGIYGNIKLRTPNIVASIGSLYNHLLARDYTARERELVTRAARRSIVGANGGKAIGQIGVHSPRRLIRAHIGATSSAAGLGACGCERAVIFIAAGDRLGYSSDRVPGTAGLAAVPVTGGSSAAGLSCSEGGRGQQSQEDGCLVE